MRWPSQAGCRGTGSAAASSICGPAPRAGRRTPDRTTRRLRPGIRPCATAIPLGGSRVSCPVARSRCHGAVRDTARPSRRAFPGRRSLQAADAPCRRSHSALRCSPWRRLRGSRSGAGAPSCCAWGRHRHHRNRRAEASGRRDPCPGSSSRRSRVPEPCTKQHRYPPAGSG